MNENYKKMTERTTKITIQQRRLANDAQEKNLLIWVEWFCFWVNNIWVGAWDGLVHIWEVFLALAHSQFQQKVEGLSTPTADRTDSG